MDKFKVSSSNIILMLRNGIEVRKNFRWKESYEFKYFESKQPKMVNISKAKCHLVVANPSTKKSVLMRS